MARLQISVLSCYPTVTVRGKANVNVCAFFGFSHLGGLGSQVETLWEWGAPKMFASGRFRRSYATGVLYQVAAVHLRPLQSVLNAAASHPGVYPATS